MNTLAAAIDGAIRPFIRAEPYALIDYPNYLNPGDCAIWLGTRKLLETMHGRPPVYVSTLRNFDHDRCLKSVGSGTLYFKGGGNLGSIYLKHDEMRARILAGMRGRRIVLLPQSIADDADDSRSGTLNFIRDNPETVVFARDTVSKAAIEGRIGRCAPLCPDLCHSLSFKQRKIGVGTGLLLRRDPEVGTFATASKEIVQSSWDWDDISTLRAWNRLGKLPVNIPNSFGRALVQDRVAKAKVESALGRLSASAVIITDRLHGVILAQSIGRRVIALDNATGKVKAYQQTWGSLLKGVSMAASLERALIEAAGHD